MKRNHTRREVLRATGYGATAVALTHWGGLLPARAEDKFTIASPGGTYNEAIRAALVGGKFQEKYGDSIAYSQQNDSVAVSKIVTQCGNPPFSVALLAASDAILLADGGCVQGYDLDIVTNYKDIVPTSKQPPGHGMEAYWAANLIIVFALVWNTKAATKPDSFKDIWSAKYKGRVGVPAYSWYGMWWLHAVNKVLGGNEDNITPGIQAVAELVKKNNAVIIENADQGIKAFTREEIVIAPFFNGRGLTMHDRGVPVEVAYVPGSVELGSGFIIPKGTRFTEQANAFINSSLDPVNQVEMARRLGYPPSNRLAKLPSNMEHYLVPEQAWANMVSLDYQKVNNHRQEYLDRWNREVLG